MNVLLSSVGRRSYLVEYFREALRGRGRVIATNTIAETTGMLAADVAETAPLATEAGFVDALLEVCCRHQVKLLFSLHDWEAPFIAAHKKRFLQHGVIPVIPDPDIVDTCLDKYKTSLLMKRLGIPSPKSFIEIEDILHALDCGEIEYPLVLKPRRGQGSIAFKIAFSRKELFLFHEQLIAELQQDKTSFLADENVDHHVLFQEYVRGQEYGVDIVNDLNGNFAACFTKRKLAMRSGETDGAVTVSNVQIEQYAKVIAGATKHPGNLDADFFELEDGSISLLELNPRFGGGYPFSHIAGANIPAALIAWANGDPIKAEWLQIENGIRAFKSLQIIQM